MLKYKLQLSPEVRRLADPLTYADTERDSTVKTGERQI
jgi:hypothetical protein